VAGTYDGMLFIYTVELFLTASDGNASILLAGDHEQVHVRYHGWDGGEEASLVIWERIIDFVFTMI
jgi:hypothetical protein